MSHPFISTFQINELKNERIKANKTAPKIKPVRSFSGARKNGKPCFFKIFTLPPFFKCDFVQIFIRAYSANCIKTVFAKRNVLNKYFLFKTVVYETLAKTIYKLKFNISQKKTKKLNQDENSIDVILPCTTAPSRVKEFIFKSSPQKVIS